MGIRDIVGGKADRGDDKIFPGGTKSGNVPFYR